MGDAVDLALNATDAGGYGLTCTASGLPAGLSIDPGTGEITGTIATSAANPTPYSVTVVASDGSASSTQTFSWTVSGVTVADPGDQTNTVGDAVSLQMTASDLNNIALTYSATGLPDGLTIGSNTGLISGTVSSGAAVTGWFDVVVTATDGTYSTDRGFSWWIASSNDTGSQLGTAQGATLTGIEGVDTGAITVATFTDTDPSADQSSFDATINWGDGTSSEGIITGSGGTFTVTGDHAYGTFGSYSTDVSITDDFGTVDGIGSAAITDAPLSMSGSMVEGAVAGSSVTDTWASFTDLNPTDLPGDYTATISWGDGSAPTTGTVTGSDGEFLVSGSHTYATVGAYTVTVNVSDAGGATGSTTSTAEVGNIYAGINTGLTVASFTSSDPNATAGQFTATVNWGDGSPLDHGATVTGSNGNFTVLGSHAYAVDSLDQSGGAYQVTVTVTGPNMSTLSTTQAVRVERPPQVGAAENVSVQPDGSLTNVEVATFTEPDMSDGTGEFSATISWGDGSSSTGTVTGSSGVFHVLGSHIYTTSGEFHVEVVVSQAWGFYAPAMLLPQVIAMAPGQASEKPPLAKGTPLSGDKNLGDLWQLKTDLKSHEFDLLDSNDNNNHPGDLVGVYRTTDAASGVTFGLCRYPKGRNGQFFLTNTKGAFSKIVWYNWESNGLAAGKGLLVALATSNARNSGRRYAGRLSPAATPEILPCAAGNLAP